MTEKKPTRRSAKSKSTSTPLEVVLRADLDTPEGVAACRAHFGSGMPTLTDDDLRAVAAVGAALDQALTTGDAQQWKRVRQATAALAGGELDDRRTRVLRTIEAGIRLAGRDDTAQIVIEDLTSIDPRFAALQPDRVRVSLRAATTSAKAIRSAARGNGAAYTAAEFAISCGALDDGGKLVEHVTKTFLSAVNRHG